MGNQAVTALTMVVAPLIMTETVAEPLDLVNASMLRCSNPAMTPPSCLNQKTAESRPAIRPSALLGLFVLDLGELGIDDVVVWCLAALAIHVGASSRPSIGGGE